MLSKQLLLIQKPPSESAFVTNFSNIQLRVRLIALPPPENASDVRLIHQKLVKLNNRISATMH